MGSETRRKFIKQSLSGAAALASLTGCAHGHRTVDSAAFEKLRERVKGEIVLPRDAPYESARRVFYWNSQTERAPAAIVQCAHEDDVARAVEFARVHELK